MIIDKHLMPASRAREWKDWRLEVLYTTDVNEVLAANLELIAQLYSHVTTGNKTKYAAALVKYAMQESISSTSHMRQMPTEKAIKLFTDGTDVGLTAKEAVYCLGMSKMTVVLENEGESKKYKTLAFVEFLEMIARVAH